MGKWIAGLVATVVVAGAGVYAYEQVWDAAPDDVAVGLTPADAAAFGSLYVQPSNDQKRAIDSLLKKFPQTESFDDTKNMLVELLDAELEPLDINFEDDIEPWLGDQIGFFVMAGQTGDQPSAAALIATTDEDAAADTVEKIFASQEDAPELEEKTYEGVEYQVDASPDAVDPPGAYGFVENFLVVGTEDALKASVDAAEGDSLEDSEDYQAAVEPFYEDRLALVYVDGQAVLDAANEVSDTEVQESVDALDRAGVGGPFALAVRAAENGAMLETSASLEDEGFFADLTRAFGGGGLVRDMPGGSWAAFGVPQVGQLSETIISIIEDAGGGPAVDEAERTVQDETGLGLRDDLLSWMGDAAIFVQGTDLQSLGGGLVIESSDPGKTDSALDALAARVNRDEPGTLEPVEKEGRSGYTFQPFGFPVPVNILGGESLVVAVGEKSTTDLLSGESTLGDSERFQEVDALLGSDLNPIFFVDIKTAMTLAETFMVDAAAEDDTYRTEVKPILEHFTYAVIGVKTEGDTTLQRFVVGIE
jgi:Protein of unknown function (DUF3352)